MGLWFLLPNLSADGCSIICLSPGTRNLPQSPRPFKDERQQLQGDTSQIPQQLPVRPVWSHGPSYSTGHWIHPPLLWLLSPSPSFDFWKCSLRPWSRLKVWRFHGGVGSYYPSLSSPLLLFATWHSCGSHSWSGLTSLDPCQALTFLLLSLRAHTALLCRLLVACLHFYLLSASCLHLSSVRGSSVISSLYYIIFS